MRVAYVCADPGVPVFGRKGCSVHVQEVIRAMTRQGARVQLFAARLGGPPPPGLNDVEVHELPHPQGETRARERAAVKANRALRRTLDRSGRFDVIYERYSLWSFAAMRAAREMSTPGVLEVNAPLVEEQAEHRALCHRTAAVRIARRNFEAARSIVAVSQGVADYVERFGISEGRVHVVPNGVDPARFPSAPDRASCSRAHGTFTVGFVGTLKSWHGLPVLVEAFALLHAEDPSVRLIVVGDGPERERLHDSLQARGLSAAAVLTGAVSPQQIPEWLAAMDAAVAPYAAQAGFYFSPLKVLEYMAAGLPVVASRIGQLTQLIEHDRTGLLCTPDAPDALAAQLRRLRDDAALRLRLGAAARAYVVREHTWEAAIARVLRTVDLTLPGRPSDERSGGLRAEARR